MSSRSSKSESASSLPAYVIVGTVRKPHGVRGAVVVEVLSDVDHRFRVGSQLEIVQTGQPPAIRAIAEMRRDGEIAIVRFEGLEDRDAAAELRGALLQVPRADVPAPSAGSYYFFELVGCRCVDARAGDLGRVERVLEDGGGLVLEVRRGADTLLVPFVRAYLTEIDTANRRLELDLPEGLVETCTSRF